MKKSRKVIFIVLAAVLVIGATLGAVAVAQASEQVNNQAQPSSAAASANLSLFEKIAALYKGNTGTTLDATELQKAFNQAHQDLMAGRKQALKDRVNITKERVTITMDEMLKKMVENGKITQQQADDLKKWLDAKPAVTLSDEYKKWLESRPSTALSNEYKKWLESRPEGIPFGPGMPGHGDRMKNFGR
jgi:hypothetical protein